MAELPSAMISTSLGAVSQVRSVVGESMLKVESMAELPSTCWVGTLSLIMMLVEQLLVLTTIFTPCRQMVAWSLVTATSKPMTAQFAWNLTLTRTMGTKMDEQHGTFGATNMGLVIRMGVMGTSASQMMRASTTCALNLHLMVASSNIVMEKWWMCPSMV